MRPERIEALDAIRSSCPDCLARGHKQILVYLVAEKRHVYRCTSCGAIHDGALVAAAPTP